MWSSVGSAGTLDPANEGKILFDGAIAQLGVGLGGVVAAASARAEARTEAAGRAFFPRISATIRYAVTTPDGIDGVDSFKIALQLRYRRGDGQVLATLFQVPIPVPPNDPGVVIETPLNHFDSDIFGGAADSFQNGDVGNLVGGHIVDFTNNAYYVAVTLIAPNRPFLSVPPAVAAIRLFSS
jgi:hypothetical protein